MSIVEFPPLTFNIMKMNRKSQPSVKRFIVCFSLFLHSSIDTLEKNFIKKKYFPKNSRERAAAPRDVIEASTDMIIFNNKKS